MVIYAQTQTNSFLWNGFCLLLRGRLKMTWNRLKWIAMISMLIDHAQKVLFPQVFFINFFGMDRMVSFWISHTMSAVGRIAFPIFAYGIAQGCMYTHSKGRYLLRLLLFAVISEVPFNLALNAVPIGFKYFAFHNVFFTLLLGALCCYIYAFFREKGMAWVSFVPVIGLMLLAEFLGTDYGGFGIAFILLPYIFFKNKKARIASLALVTVAFYVFYAQFTGFVSGHYPFAWMNPIDLSFDRFFDTFGALFAVALLALYNGQKGKSYHKWVFYIFYPAHLLLLYLLTFVVPNYSGTFNLVF